MDKSSVSSGTESVNNALGMDLNLQFNSVSRLTGQVAVSSRPDIDTDGHAGQINYQYSNKLINPSDNINFSLGVEEATDDFDISEIGYFGRTSLNRRGGKENLGYQYWIKNKGINRVSFNHNGWYYRDHEWEERVQDGASAEFTIETINLIAPGFLIERSYYYLPGDKNSYHNDQRTVSVNFGPYPRFRSEVSYRTGDNFGSSIKYFDTEVIVKPTNKMRITCNYSRLISDPFDTAESSSTNNIARVGFNYLFTPDFYWRVFVQSDSSDKLYLVNTMLRYEFKPGSTFYLSYKETRDDMLDNFITSDRQLLAKLSYYLPL
ncbi:MAG: hypothetical protein JXB48_11990 [Candidatus Latescibacteria bacterium]|nr:hypothetical protein [Candidatus Latescibacterota bacterium]